MAILPNGTFLIGRDADNIDKWESYKIIVKARYCYVNLALNLKIVYDVILP